MANQQRCCIIGACCVPFSAEQEAALTEYLSEAMADPEQGEEATDAMRVRCRRAAKKLYADRLIRQAT